MSDTNDWLAVYYTDDGPFVYGPYKNEDEAHEAIIGYYMAECGLDRDDALVRYDNTGDEWVTRLQDVSSS